MPVYAYKGLDGRGRAVNGVKDADSPKALRVALKREGLFLTDITEERTAKTPERKEDKRRVKVQVADERSPFIRTLVIVLVAEAVNLVLAFATGGVDSANNHVALLLIFSVILFVATTLRERGMQGFGGVKLLDVAVATRQLATLQGAGIALIDSLNALSEQVEDQRFKVILSQIKTRVNEGTSLADAMREHPRVFSNLYVNMIRAGESSGTLDVVLKRLADFTESQTRLRQKITGTMTYPIIMLVMGLGVVSILFIVVVPKITKIFDSVKMTLPFATVVLIAISQFLRDYWAFFLVAIAAAVVTFNGWRSSARGRIVWDAAVLKLPVFGSLIRMLSLARFSRTLATLLQNGVSMLTAMDIVKSVVTNATMQRVIEEARESIREGESISAPLKRSGEFPPIVTHMIAVGEKSGQLEDMLNNVADAYDHQVEVSVNALTTLLEPLMIVGMGGVVTFVVFSILLPILKMTEAVR